MHSVVLYSLVPGLDTNLRSHLEGYELGGTFLVFEYLMCDFNYKSIFKFFHFLDILIPLICMYHD